MGELNFKSPQTGSDYQIVGVAGPYLVCQRGLGDGKHRVRIQANDDAPLDAVKAELPTKWGGVKGDDHLSIVVDTQGLPAACADALRAVMVVDLGGDEDEDEDC